MFCIICANIYTSVKNIAISDCPFPCYLFAKAYLKLLREIRNHLSSLGTKIFHLVNGFPFLYLVFHSICLWRQFLNNILQYLQYVIVFIQPRCLFKASLLVIHLGLSLQRGQIFWGWVCGLGVAAVNIAQVVFYWIAPWIPIRYEIMRFKYLHHEFHLF